MWVPGSPAHSADQGAGPVPMLSRHSARGSTCATARHGLQPRELRRVLTSASAHCRVRWPARLDQPASAHTSPVKLAPSCGSATACTQSPSTSEVLRRTSAMSPPCSSSSLFQTSNPAMRGTSLVPGAEVGVRVHGLHVGGLLGGLLGAEVPVPGHHHEVLGVEVLVQLRADGGGDDPPGRDHRARAVVSAQPQQLRLEGFTLPASAAASP